VLSEIKSQHNNLSDFNKMKNKNLTSCSSLLDLQYGKSGTKSRKKNMKIHLKFLKKMYCFKNFVKGVENKNADDHKKLLNKEFFS